MRSKSHDQRKGQWLINKIRFAEDFPKINYDKFGWEQGMLIEKKLIELKIWNMENNEFDRLMEDYDK